MADLIVTEAIASAATKGLRLVEEGKAGDGLVPRTITDARRMANREPLSERKVKAMPGWFARHASDKAPNWDKAGEETPGYVAWLLWGGDTAAEWAQRQVEALAHEGRSADQEMPDEVSPRQQSMIEELVSIAEEYGPFDTSTGANGAHYAPADANPFKSEGLICANCELYQPISDTEGRCAVVQGPLTDGNVDPNAICKLWVIPESKLVPAEGTREEVMKAEIRIVEERDLRENPDLLSELRNGADIVEKRRVETEVRADQTGKGWKLTGYAAVFDSETSLGNFNERIARGAFRKVLKRTDLDVAALFNHDQNLILGRTTNGTLTLREDPRGLVYEVDVADTSYGRDLKVLLERGDVTQSSFAFRVKSDGQQWTENQDGTLVRTITEFEDLLDVSPVVYPAYADTTSVALTRNNQTSSTRETEQEGQGSAEQQSSQAGSQPRRADEEGAHRQRVRRLKLRDRAA